MKNVFKVEEGLCNLPNKVKRITAGCILINCDNDGLNVALVRNKWSRKWGFPKGGVEKNESLKVAAERETLEETGIYVKLENNINSYRINKTTYFIKILDSKLKMNPRDFNEIIDTRWFNIKNLPNTPDTSTRDIRIFKELQKGSLKCYLENLEKHFLSKYKSLSYKINNKDNDSFKHKWKNMVKIG